jgi:diadenosine tetraphosphatase ApaH/serine/threonine PP2A family protein phosphatase
LEALNAVIAAAAPFDQIWCLGDLVGYGPDPNDCIRVLSRYSQVAVAGNHDWVASGKRTAAGFNPHAAAAARWTALQLTPETRRFLDSLPDKRQMGSFLLVHGSPRLPTQEYLFTPEDAARSLPQFTSGYCLVGHTHVPCVFVAAEAGSAREVYRVVMQPEETLPLHSRMRMIINPGSVGQPRDNDPRAAYMTFDSAIRALQMHRVAYDIGTTQQKMRDASLPESLIDRLTYGV